jgi:pimeloyl-ACP methyl ester carboxylesterase
MQTSVNGLKLNYETLGKGEPILLLHGWGGSLESLTALGTRLKAKGGDQDENQLPNTQHPTPNILQPILLDLPGFGKSDTPKSDFSLDDYAETVEEFLKQQGVKELYVFGHSFGGAIAIKLAVRGNIQIKKLVLCNASGIRNVQSTMYNLQLRNIAKKVSQWPIIKSIYPTLRKFYYYYILRNRDYIDHQEIAGTFKKVVAEDLTPILKDVKVPTLLLWGELDKDTPLEHAKIMESKIACPEHSRRADCRLKIVKGIGHGLPKQRPELVAKEVHTFILS